MWWPFFACHLIFTQVADRNFYISILRLRSFFSDMSFYSETISKHQLIFFWRNFRYDYSSTLFHEFLTWQNNFHVILNKCMHVDGRPCSSDWRSHRAASMLLNKWMNGVHLLPLTISLLLTATTKVIKT